MTIIIIVHTAAVANTKPPVTAKQLVVIIPGDQPEEGPVILSIYATPEFNGLFP